tara:strand:- start:277 stop:657 length:381 start_codon:yes stop_codon:yes gene_type:complete
MMNEQWKRGLRKVWKLKSGVYAQNSFGVTAEESDVWLTFHVDVPGWDERGGKQRGYFEWYSDESDNDWYASGMLSFTDGELTDFDGVYSLSSHIIKVLHEHGFDVEEMARVCAPTLHKELFGGEEE